MNQNPQWLKAQKNHIGEIEDAFAVAREFREAEALIHEHDPNDERTLRTVLRGLYNEIDYLRRENNTHDANADKVIEELRGDLGRLQSQYAALRGEVLVKDRLATDFLMKNEALRAENATRRTEQARLEDEVDGLRVELHAAQQINRDLTQPNGKLKLYLFRRLEVLRFGLQAIAESSDLFTAQALRQSAKKSLDDDDRAMNACTTTTEAKG